MTAFDLEEREQPEPRLRLVEVSGELDLTNARDLEARLEDLPDDGVVIVLDLNRVFFIDSAALHALFRVVRRRGVDRFGIALEPSAAIARTLEITGLPQLVAVRGTAEEVLAAVAATTR